MRHHNRARLIDIADMELDPTVEHAAGPDGRLHASSAKEKNKKDEKEDAKQEKSEETPLEQEATENTVEQAPKKNTRFVKKSTTTS